jgi:hypothetical protein
MSDERNARLDRIETTLAETVDVLRAIATSHVTIQETLKSSIVSQSSMHQSLTEGLTAVTGGLTALSAAQLRTEQSLAELNTAIAQYTAAADARMRRIEDNLDGLIRAITAEHTNGKQKLG